MISGAIASSVVTAIVALLAQDGSTDTETTPTVTDSGYVVQASDARSLRLVDRPVARPVGVWIECAYLTVASIDAPVEVVTQPVVPRVGGVYSLWCWYQPDQVVVPGYPIVVAFDPVDPAPGLVDVFDVAAFAQSQMELEAPEPVLSPATAQVVGVETWLAVVSELEYPDVTAQAGLAWATVRATFADVVWDLGDGATVRCTDDVGVTWDPGLAGADQASACIHVYEASSPAGGYGASVTVTWELEWINNESPDQFAPWTTLSLTTPVSIEVDQLQAVIR